MRGTLVSVTVDIGQCYSSARGAGGGGSAYHCPAGQVQSTQEYTIFCVHHTNNSQNRLILNCFNKISIARNLKFLYHE